MDTANLTLHPQHHLDDIDQKLLLAHASGMTNSEIARQLGADMATVNQLNRQLQKKLDARSLPHAIAQAFINGILAIKAKGQTLEGQAFVRTLCLCLALTTGAQSFDSDMMRTRTPCRGGRNPNTIMRVVRAGRNKEIDA